MCGLCTGVAADAGEAAVAAMAKGAAAEAAGAAKEAAVGVVAGAEAVTECRSPQRVPPTACRQSFDERELGSC